jgi:nucleoside-diphosphate-sugar epimerase
MKIAIVGGSSQVGFSLALYLKHYYKIELTAFVRSSYAKNIYDLCDIKCDFMDFSMKNEKNLLSEFDVVVDFTYPTGQIFEIKANIQKNIDFVISQMSRNSIYIYMSSIMAFGTSDVEFEIKNRIIPRTNYAFLKRLAEKNVKRISKKYGIKGVNFRLGQVHGFLQSVTFDYTDKFNRNNKIHVNGYKDDLTNTVFIDTICKSILEIYNQSELGSLEEIYTLVSKPQWSLENLYRYYSVCYDFDFNIEYEKRINDKKRKNFLYPLLNKYRFFFENYILINNPRIAIVLKGVYRARNMKLSEISEQPENVKYHLLGTAPLETVPNVYSLSVQETLDRENVIKSIYINLITRNV